MILETRRLRLRCWREADREHLAEMNAHPEVMHDLGGPIDRIGSDGKLDRYVAAYEQFGFGRWLVESREGRFLGYAGVMPCRGEHPLGSHNEIGWRLTRQAWGYGFATEAARAALKDAFARVGLNEVVAYTTSDNVRSQAVMARLNLRRDPMRDFTVCDGEVGSWRGLVWSARPD